MAWVNLASFVPCTESEGPGRRAALWVQGCAKRCPECCNPDYLKIFERAIVPASALVERVARAQLEFGIEGVTFLGGEPLLQAKGLAEVAQECHRLGLSVMTFTGYTVDEIRQLNLDGAAELLANIDLLVDGPYIAEQTEARRNWVGSSNQQFHYLTDRYDATVELDPAGGRSVEFQVGLDGRLRVNGWPNRLEGVRSAGRPR